MVLFIRSFIQQMFINYSTMIIDEGPFVFRNDRQGEAWNVKFMF